MRDKPYEQAVVKFNNGRGALLCNVCYIIIATGFDHADEVHLCETCKQKTQAEIDEALRDEKA